MEYRDCMERGKGRGRGLLLWERGCVGDGSMGPCMGPLKVQAEPHAPRALHGSMGHGCRARVRVKDFPRISHPLISLPHV